MKAAFFFLAVLGVLSPYFTLSGYPCSSDEFNRYREEGNGFLLEQEASLQAQKEAQPTQFYYYNEYYNAPYPFPDSYGNYYQKPYQPYYYHPLPPVPPSKDDVIFGGNQQPASQQQNPGRALNTPFIESQANNPLLRPSVQNPYNDPFNNPLQLSQPYNYPLQEAQPYNYQQSDNDTQSSDSDEEVAGRSLYEKQKGAESPSSFYNRGSNQYSNPNNYYYESPSSGYYNPYSYPSPNYPSSGQQQQQNRQNYPQNYYSPNQEVVDRSHAYDENYDYEQPYDYNDSYY